jgi:hypothetical protein
MCHEGGSLIAKSVVGTQRPTRPKESLLVYHSDAVPQRVAFEVASDHIGQMMRVHKKTLHPSRSQRFNPHVQQGPAANLNHALGSVICERAQTCSKAGSKKDSIHEQLLEDTAASLRRRNKRFITLR